MMVLRTPPAPVRHAIAAAAGLLLSCPPAFAQVMSASPYLPAPDPAVERLSARLETLEAELRRVTGRLEQMGFELAEAARTAASAERAGADQAKALAELRERIDVLLATTTPDTAGGAPAAAPAAEKAVLNPDSLPQDEAGLLRESRNLLLEGDYPSAEAAFRRFLNLHPKSEQAAEAQYLLADSLLYQEAYAEAAEAYVRLLTAHETSPRAPEGLVKLARSMRLMGEKARACEALGQMKTRFPKASEAARTLAAAERSRAGC